MSVMAAETYNAHSPDTHGRWHPLAEHLHAVAECATTMAIGWPWKDEARLAGLLHDLGKYGDLFQRRLRGAESGLDHWSVGALEALLSHQAFGAALAIEGHHVGLQAASEAAVRSRFDQTRNGRSPFGAQLRLSDAERTRLLERAAADGLRFAGCATPSLPLTGDLWSAPVARMLDLRVLFSCLVDADFLDTEAHFNGTPKGKQAREPGPRLQANAALHRLESFMAESVRGKRAGSTAVAEVRSELWQAVGAAAESPTGLFTLTAPTGSGKTLAMLQFALRHAARNKLSRVVLAVPYLSIIEQTAREYRRVFAGEPENFVLEHHSLAGLGEELSKSDAEGNALDDTERQRRLLSQNWDAPIVLTTNVQLLESLFSNRPAACRKLHHLRDAVILFDEAQSLPQGLAVATLAALSHLSASSHSSVVFATATQPAFDSLHDEVTKNAVGGWRPAEIVPAHAGMFSRLKRVETHWPGSDENMTWAELAEELASAQAQQALCIVNLKRHAHELLRAMDGADGLFHLSTNLCSTHRRAVLDEVRGRLNPAAPQPCRLVSTQCVEAGVDLDFPVVYRAMAPLEAIAQAAGRCNREGRLNLLGRFGQMRIFEPALDASGRRYMFPTHGYYQATQVTLSLLKDAGGELDINDPEAYRRYYRRLYDLSDPASQNAELNKAIQALHYPDIARCYRLIDQDAIQVVVPWSQRIDEYEELREQSMRGIDARWIARAQAFAVSIFRPKPGHPAWGCLVAAKLRRGGPSDEWYVLEDPNRLDLKRRLYDDTLGLRLPDSQQVMIA
jgi:CRISPR-associated endonuclease/helicase Cas3